MMNLSEKLIDTAKAQPEWTALRDRNKSISYSMLIRRISSNAQRITHMGYAKQTVFLRITDSVDFGIALLSLFAAGCWVVPAPPDISEDLCRKLKITYGIKIELASNAQVFSVACENDGLFTIHQESCGIYHLTSGSTGEPKLCIRSVRNLIDEALSYTGLFALDGNKILSLAPVYHSFSLGAAFMASLISGSSLHVVNQFKPRQAVDIIGRWNPDIVVAVPIMAKAIAEISLSEHYNFHTLKFILIGTGNVTKEVNRQLKQRFGVSASINYGSTETGGLISRLTEEPEEAIGTEMTGVEIKLLDSDGNAVPTGTEGEAYVKCKYMMSGYLDQKERVFDPEGFFPMGDILLKDLNGYYYVKGRIKNIINIGGKKVNPKEVESILLEYPGVRDCVVEGFCRGNTEQVRAYIDGEAVDEFSLRQYLKEHLEAHKIPTIINFVPYILRNSSGKLMKAGHINYEKQMD